MGKNFFYFHKNIFKNKKKGKTSFKERMIGLHQNPNQILHKIVPQNKREEDMTHGVDICSWTSEDNTLFSLWDFAGK